MHTPGIAHPRKTYRKQYSRHPLLQHLSFIFTLLALLNVSSCKDGSDPQPAPSQAPQVFTASKTFTVINRMGQPIALFLFTETTTTAPPGPATAVLDVRVQNVSTCKVSFPYTITFTPRQPGQPVNKELHGTVTNLPVNMVVEAHNKVAALPFNLRTANIVITPHGEPQRADCASLEGNWAGAYTMSSENLYNMDFGVVTHEETGNVYVTVPAVGGPVEIRYVQIAGSRPLRDVSTSLVGTLSPDYEFNGQGLVRSSSDHVVDTVRAAGLLRVLADPVSGKPNISVGLRLKYAKTYADIMFLSSNVKLQ